MTPATLAKAGTEHSHQRALFAWANMAAQFGFTAAGDERSYSVKGHAAKTFELHLDCFPELARMHAVHNQGHGDAIRGARAKAEGVKAGVPDIFLPIPRRNFHGFYIELKKPKEGVVSEAQTDWIGYLCGAGYAVETCYGWEAARHSILAYLGLLNGHNHNA